MKRLNPSTGSEFKFGDVREDGFIFHCYRLKRLNKDGYFRETWLSRTSFENQAKNTAKWASENPEKKKLAVVKWCANNLTTKRKRNSDWKKLNLAKNAAQTMKRHSAKLKRTPNWLTIDQMSEIEDFYTAAKLFQMYTGESYHVDHIIPLQGKTVSGLHVPWNLQVLPAKQNISKGNRHGV